MRRPHASASLTGRFFVARRRSRCYNDGKRDWRAGGLAVTAADRLPPADPVTVTKTTAEFFVSRGENTYEK